MTRSLARPGVAPGHERSNAASTAWMLSLTLRPVAWHAPRSSIARWPATGRARSISRPESADEGFDAARCDVERDHVVDGGGNLEEEAGLIVETGGLRISTGEEGRVRVVSAHARLGGTSSFDCSPSRATPSRGVRARRPRAGREHAALPA